jgi:hypothetical protein
MGGCIDMSKIYVSMTSDATKREATKTANRFADAHLRTYTVGMEIACHTDPDGIVHFTCYKTGGSNGTRGEILAEFSELNH